MERKLATIRRIVSVSPIEGADRIQLARINGWQSVIKKDEYKPGDLVVFIEIDSILPFKPWSEFLRDKKNPDKPIRLRTVRLKRTLSQGLIIPLDVLPKDSIYFEEGTDVTEVLDITKYEPYIPAQLAGKVKGSFPNHIVPKTDSERIQNLWGPDFINEVNGIRLVGRVKEDGTSFTVGYKDDEVFVCSRNLMLDMSDEGNVYVRMAKKYNFENLLKNYGHDISIQAEIVGPGIQKNHSKVSDTDIKVFDVHDNESHRYFSYERLHQFCVDNKLPEVETVTDDFRITTETTYEELFKLTERQYKGTDNQIEGIVFTAYEEIYSYALSGRLRFKVINPDYLLKNE